MKRSKPIISLFHNIWLNISPKEEVYNEENEEDGKWGNRKAFTFSIHYEYKMKPYPYAQKYIENK